jgi:hypothetical protein
MFFFRQQTAAGWTNTRKSAAILVVPLHKAAVAAVAGVAEAEAEAAVPIDEKLVCSGVA